MRDRLRFTARRAGRSAVALLLLALVAGSGAAQEAGTVVRTDVGEQPAAAPPDVAEGAIRLSLEEAIEIGLRQNLGLLVERYNRTQARLGVQRELGIYDLLLEGQAQAVDQTSPALSQLETTSFEQQSLDLGVAQLFPTGGRLSVGLDSEREVSDFARLNPTYDTDLTFSFAQPLLRDFGRVATERGLRISQVDSRVSREEFERQVTETIRQIEDAYWNLVEAREQLVVAEESLGLARELHERNRIQVEVGTLPPLDLVQSEANIATRDEGIIGAQAQVGDAADVLRRLLNLPPGELWELPIEPETDPATERITVDVEQAVQTAFVERPEIATQRLAIERSGIEAAFFRNQKRPTLDLAVGYNTTGGNVVGIDPVTELPIGGGFSDALEQLTGFDFYGWSVRLVFGYPLQNRTARAQSTIAELDVERTETELADLESVVRTEVRAAVRGLDTAAKQIEAARASRTLQERNLDAERKRYENGMSTSFQITEIQEDLTLARSREVSAIANYRRALTEYYRATGTLLERNGVALADEEAEVRRFTLFGGNG